MNNVFIESVHELANNFKGIHSYHNVDCLDDTDFFKNKSSWSLSKQSQKSHCISNSMSEDIHNLNAALIKPEPTIRTNYIFDQFLNTFTGIPTELEDRCGHTNK